MSTLILKVDENGESKEKGVLFLPALPLPPNYNEGDYLFNLRLVIPAACPISRNGIIWINVPEDHKTPFERSKYHKRSIENSFTCDNELDFKIYQPGTYSYYISYRDGSNHLKTTRKFYFVVPPSLYINDKFLPLNSIALESVISKWLGPRDDWDKAWDEISKKNYNMVHFTPLQERGESNSPYSIFDQLTFDKSLFKDQQDVESMVQKLHVEKNLLSITDVVFNHTANNSTWLREHPDAGYNKETAPHLTAAIELDGQLLDFSSQLKELGYPTVLNNVSDLLQIMDGIKTHVLNDLKLWEFYVINVERSIKELKDVWNSNQPLQKIEIPNDINDSLVKLAEYVTENAATITLGYRYDNKIDALKFATILNSVIDNVSSFEALEEHARKVLDEVNLPRYREYDNDVSDIMEQVFNRTKYLRIDDHGPKMGEITKENPLTEPYFTRFTADDGKDYQLANNGWIWNGNPLVDFASDQTKSYLTREVIIWGDCVKLRYGSGPEDSPHLWERMEKYVKLSAKIFDGFRIDNCHSTPLHVGEYFLDVARRVNHHLYIVAELFSGSEDMDNLFVERLGISSLIREAMQAWSVDELSRLVYRHAGLPIGSFQPLPLDDFAYPPDGKDEVITNSLSEIQIPRILRPVHTHALFMDCTHDNEMPYDKRTVEDTLPNAALVSFCATAVGSVMGYDECYPHLLDVVNEKRQYTFGSTGIGEVKSELYKLRQSISESSYNAEDHEMHVHHEGQYITLQRLNAKTGDGWFLIARTKFNQADGQWLAPVVLKGTKAIHEFSYSLEKIGDPEEDPEKLTSVPVRVKKLEDPKVESINGDSQISLPDYFPQGSILVLKVTIEDVNQELDDYIRNGAIEATEGLTLYDLNALLYKCESEERDSSAGQDGVYNIPDHGRLVYAGLQGWISVLRDVIQQNDLAHPIADHLRKGLWASDYVTNRLLKYTDDGPFTTFAEWLKTRLEKIKQVPFFLVPRYFALVIGIAYEALRFRALSLFVPEIQNGNLFLQRLALTSVQMVGIMRSTSLTPSKQVPSMAAGLPHFSYDYMRCWGRDVFISTRGLLLATGRYDDARNHILNFAATLKHGLIPNLLDAGRNPRYNARDAAWFFLQCIQDYINIAPHGENILQDKVKRRFPLDDRFITYDDPEAFSYETSIEDIIYEILSRHAKGIKYREANAGARLDCQMKDEGFNVEVFVDWETGLVHGGSQSNCGTWMDKMGESAKAGNKGVPGTPRDGAAIEINGLLKSALRFTLELHEKGLFKYDSVKKSTGEEITLKEWNDLLQDSFEKCYYVPKDAADDHKYKIDPSIVNRRGIYKDLYKTGKPFEDYQLRANFPIAMTVAPELFTPENAIDALELADEVIRGPLGMRTLDPSDYNYRPYYLNSDDSDDFSTAKGRNYHQGPEWVWCYGYFLRAFHHFHYQDDSFKNDLGEPSSRLNQLLADRLKEHRRWIRESPWAGLTELTNKDGELCYDSSPTQAWSTSCLLDLHLDLWKKNFTS